MEGRQPRKGVEVGGDGWERLQRCERGKTCRMSCLGTRRGVELEAFTQVLTRMCTGVDGEYYLPRQRNEGRASGTGERMSCV